MWFESEDLSWRTGTEISGLDLSRGDEIPQEAIQALWKLLGERGILLFRNQTLDHDQHLAFSRRFAPLYPDRGLLTRSTPAGYPDIYMVTNMKVEGVRSFTYDSARMWHSDMSFMEQPPSASLLYCERAPRIGGNTLFANMYQAYEGLSEGLRKTLEGLRAFHTALNQRAKAPRARQATKDRPMTEAEAKVYGGALHPMVKVHPDTGRKCLYFSEQSTERFEGWTIEESMPLLSYLEAFATQPAFTHRHAWRPGDLVMWDNRCVMHHAPADYDLNAMDAPENQRRMYRTELAYR